jgi:hypothetical protein
MRLSMNHYDDLQRFQEKTRTQNLKFQDLSSQAATREHGDWAILNQLNPGAEKPSSLALGGSVSAPLPQSVPADLFQQVEAAVAAAPASLRCACRSAAPLPPAGRGDRRSRAGAGQAGACGDPCAFNSGVLNRPWRRREWPPTRARRRELCPPVRGEKRGAGGEK